MMSPEVVVGTEAWTAETKYLGVFSLRVLKGTATWYRMKSGWVNLPMHAARPANRRGIHGVALDEPARCSTTRVPGDACTALASLAVHTHGNVLLCLYRKGDLVTDHDLTFRHCERRLPANGDCCQGRSFDSRYACCAADG